MFLVLQPRRKNSFPILFLSSREKFQNYLGDLGKHRKQLEEKNDQLVEELQGLSKRHLVYNYVVTTTVCQYLCVPVYQYFPWETANLICFPRISILFPKAD